MLDTIGGLIREYLPVIVVVLALWCLVLHLWIGAACRVIQSQRRQIGILAEFGDKFEAAIEDIRDDLDELCGDIGRLEKRTAILDGAEPEPEYTREELTEILNRPPFVTKG